MCCRDPGWSLASLTPRDGGSHFASSSPLPVCMYQVGYAWNLLSLPTTCSGPRNDLLPVDQNYRAHSLPPSHSAVLSSLCLLLRPHCLSVPLWVIPLSFRVYSYLSLFVSPSACVSLCPCLPFLLSESVSLSVSVIACLSLCICVSLHLAFCMNLCESISHLLSLCPSRHRFLSLPFSVSVCVCSSLCFPWCVSFLSLSLTLCLTPSPEVPATQCKQQ